MVSNRVKRNISATLSGVGMICIISRVWGVCSAPRSGSAWFDLCGAIIITYLCFDNFLIYRRRWKSGIKFGSR